MTKEELFFGYAKAALTGCLSGQMSPLLQKTEKQIREHRDFFVHWATVLAMKMTEEHESMFPQEDDRLPTEEDIQSLLGRSPSLCGKDTGEIK